MVKKRFVRLYIKGLLMDPHRQTPMVLLKDGKKQFELAVDIGPFEANALIVELEEIRIPRPLTHDIISILFRKHGFSMEYIELSRRTDSSIAAFLYYTMGDEHHSMEVRPSDALVLSAKMRASLFMKEHFLDKCRNESAAEVSPISNHDSEHQMSAVRDEDKNITIQ